MAKDDKADPKAAAPELLGSARRLVAKHRIVFGDDKAVAPGDDFECDAKEAERLIQLGAAEDDAPASKKKATKGA